MTTFETSRKGQALIHALQANVGPRYRPAVVRLAKELQEEPDERQRAILLEDASRLPPSHRALAQSLASERALYVPVTTPVAGVEEPKPKRKRKRKVSA